MLRSLKIETRITNRNGSLSFTKYLNEVVKIKPFATPQEELAVAKRSAAGDESARKELIEKNLRFVVSVAKQYAFDGGKRLTLEDLVNEGNCGLIKAAERFDESRGFKFISYAVWWIRQSIFSYINENARMIRLPINRTSQLSKINSVTNELRQELEREPTVDEIKECVEDCLKNGLEELLACEKTPFSLNAKIDSDNDEEIVTLLQDFESLSPDEVMTSADLKKDIASLLKKLTPRERSVMIYTFGLNGEKPKTLNEMGIEEDLTRERIRQIRVKALRRCKILVKQKSGGELKKYL